METLAFSIPGAPQSKARPRFSRWKGKVRTYDAQSEEATTIAWQMRARMKGILPLSGTLKVDLKFIFLKPKSREKHNETYHSVKPDIDNLVKWILDAGNGIIYKDDKQVSIISASKIYGNKAETIITVDEIS